MKSKKFLMGALVSVVSASVVLAGCSKGSETTTEPAPSNNAAKETKKEGPAVGGTYIRSTIGDAAVLLPILTQDTASSDVSVLIFDGLLGLDDKLNIVPAFAESYTVEQDKIYTFKLSQGVTFHDGSPATCKDQKFSFEAMSHPKYQGVRFGDFLSVKGWQELSDTYDAINAELDEKKIDEKTADEKKLAAWQNFWQTGGMTCVDDYTFKVELSEPSAPFIFDVASYGPMPKHLMEADIADLKGSKWATEPVGTGSMKFVEWVKDDHITLERFADWKLGIERHPTFIERVIFKVVPDAQANMVALETGEVHLAGIQADSWDRFKNEVKHVNLHEYPALSYTFLGYNLLNPKFSDQKVRQAITTAIPRQEIVDKLFLGHGAIANTHGSPALWSYDPNVTVFNYDPAKAAQMLDEAGWKVGADGIREKDGVKFKFEIATNNGNKYREQSAVIIQQALKQVGIEVTVNLMEWNAFLEYVDGDKKEAYILGWSLSADPDPYSIFHSKGGFNAMNDYNNPKVDELIMKGKSTTNMEERKKVYQQLGQELAIDQPYTFLYYANSLVGLTNQIQGPVKGTPAGIHWNYETWYMQTSVTP